VEDSVVVVEGEFNVKSLTKYRDYSVDLSKFVLLKDFEVL